MGFVYMSAWTWLQASDCRYQAQRRITQLLQTELLQLYSQVEVEAPASSTATSSPPGARADTLTPADSRSGWFWCFCFLSDHFAWYRQTLLSHSFMNMTDFLLINVVGFGVSRSWLEGCWSVCHFGPVWNISTATRAQGIVKLEKFCRLNFSAAQAADQNFYPLVYDQISTNWMTFHTTSAVFCVNYQMLAFESRTGEYSS